MSAFTQDDAGLRAALARDEARARLRDSVRAACVAALRDRVDPADIVWEFGIISSDIVRACSRG
jgi:hypothetical protein